MKTKIVLGGQAWHTNGGVVEPETEMATIESLPVKPLQGTPFELTPQQVADGLRSGLFVAIPDNSPAPATPPIDPPLIEDE